MEIAREGCIEAFLSSFNQPCRTLAPFVRWSVLSFETCNGSKRARIYDIAAERVPRGVCLGPTNSPTTNRVINYSIREANFLLLTFTPMLSDQPRGRCEESLVDNCCLPASYEKQEIKFALAAAHDLKIRTIILESYRFTSDVKRRPWSNRRTRQDR